MIEKQKVALIVLDGWGFSTETKDNAIATANPVFFNSLWEHCPHTTLKASGEAVGLPEGQMGNSEVGHTIIGAGKIVYTDLLRISKEIGLGRILEKQTILQLFNYVKNNNSTLHLLGLVSDGGVHSHINHLVGLIKAANDFGLEKIAIHVFTDGRDTPPQSAASFIEIIESEIDNLDVGRIASVSGRYFAMDRDNNWNRIEQAESVLFDGVGRIAPSSINASDFVHELYQHEENDEFIKPTVFPDINGEPIVIKDNDGVFFFNFRKDRARELTERIIARQNGNKFLFATMTLYDKNFNCPVVFQPEVISTCLAKEISDDGLTQAHIAETEKFAHATYFLNGGDQNPHKNEEQVLIESRKDVATHDLAPEMKAAEIADKTIEFINRNTDFIFVNFANADMVGHTANVPAIIIAIKTVDEQLKRIVEVAIEKNYAIFITADHGNAEINIDETTGKKHTAHTTNPVPAILVGDPTATALDSGSLADIAPTVLTLLGVNTPTEMTGKNLVH